jgi:hypothetical protein
MLVTSHLKVNQERLNALLTPFGIAKGLTIWGRPYIKCLNKNMHLNILLVNINIWRL